MLKYKCLVLDHDDTVVQSMKTLSYPFFCIELEQFRPGTTMSMEDYILEKIAERKAAKKAKDFALADAIRGELLEKGIILEDTREGVKWKRA